MTTKDQQLWEHCKKNDKEASNEGTSRPIMDWFCGSLHHIWRYIFVVALFGGLGIVVHPRNGVRGSHLNDTDLRVSGPSPVPPLWGRITRPSPALSRLRARDRVPVPQVCQHGGVGRAVLQKLRANTCRTAGHGGATGRATRPRCGNTCSSVCNNPLTPTRTQVLRPLRGTRESRGKVLFPVRNPNGINSKPPFYFFNESGGKI